jgi:hypothetical protein
VALERALNRGPVGIGLEAQHVFHVDPLDYEHLVLRLDLAGRLADQPALARGDSTRLQRAPEGARQSAGGGSDDVVERRSVLGFPAGHHAVVLGDLVVHAEEDGLGLTGEVGTP